MNLFTLLPRALDVHSGSECASLLGSILTVAYFERTRARGLGWRGVRPSAAVTPAWTCRVAGANMVYGLRFDGETTETDASRLCGVFSLYAFPSDKEDPLLERYPLEALRVALSDDYTDFVREFAAHQDKALPFHIGFMRMEAALNGAGLRLTLDAAARRRVVALDGIEATHGRWLVEPGASETDLPQFRLGLHFFSTLVDTAASQLDVTPSLLLRRKTEAGLVYDRNVIFTDSSHPETRLMFTATFGEEGNNWRDGRVFTRLPLRRVPELLETSGRPILHILTGFLGSGKTTFLRGWLDYLHGRERYTGVIQNEFGKEALDATLLGSETCVEALEDGCVCCSLADSLRPGIERLMTDMPAESFILETTGLANPENIYEDLGHLQDLVTAGLVITVTDSLDLVRHMGERLEERGVRRAQIEKADVLILNKADTVSPEDLDTLERRIIQINPRALILRSSWGQIPYAELDAFLDAHPEKTPLPSHQPTLRAFNAHTHADEGYTSFTIALPMPLTETETEALLQKAGSGLCRAKGIIRLKESGEFPCLVVAQYAAGRLRFEPIPERVIDEPYMVFIGRDLQQLTLETFIFRAC